MHKLLLLIAFTAASQIAFSQTNRLTGKITDAANAPLAYVTVGAYNPDDSALIGFVISDKAGLYDLKTLPGNKDLQLVVSSAGYQTFSKKLKLEQPVTELNIQLSPASSELDTVIVSFAPPVRIKKDTIEFNTAAFAGLPNEAIGDLLQRLPGLERDANGKFTINGKPVTKITVEGADFFSGNDGITLKNIPAGLIDKVQVTDDKTKRPGDSKTPQQKKQINLKLKKAAMGKPFGKFFGGAGTSSRYEGGGMLNSISSSKQFGVIGLANNLNRTGFSTSDASGMEDGSMIESINNKRQQATGYSPENSGISNNWGGGINIGAKHKKDVYNLSYTGMGASRKAESGSLSRLLIGDTILSNQTEGTSTSHVFNQSTSGTYTRTIDSNTNLYVHSTWNRTQNKTSGYDNGSISNNKEGLQNEFANANKLVMNSNQFSIVGSFNKKSANGKLEFESLTFASLAETSSQNNENRLIQYYNNNIKSVTDSISQQTKYLAKDNQVYHESGITYKPGTKHSFMFFVDYTLVDFRKTRDVFAWDQSASKSLRNDGLSFQARITQQDISPSLRYRFDYKKIGLFTSLAYSNFRQEGSLTQSATKHFGRTYHRFLPMIDFNYGDLKLRYLSRIWSADNESVIPYEDSTSRLNVVKGNSDLKPAMRHEYSAEYTKMFTKQNISLHARASYSKYKDRVTQNTSVNSKGVTYTEYLNTDKYETFNSNINISKTFQRNNRTITAGITGRFDNTHAALYNNSKEVMMKANSWTAAATLNASMKNQFSTTNEYALGYNENKYNSKDYSNYSYLRHEIKLNQTLRVFKKVSLENSMNIIFTPGLPAGFRKSTILWNAGASVHLLKQEKAQIRLSLFDLLQQNTFQEQSIELNKFTQTRNNSLGRYALLTFIYHFRAPAANAGK
ncbi:outer membrane beta-barrel protein [Pseudoflavitalea sp. G-6-1-2]|uniref:outer membrane beta-barrel protein n=1 Tax=Pseudoflavitalea sp. G-6-1-2 TaxID=2728841 RepID=UPI00146F332D|nr:outer membrane beta-barrel protein [Pseudoflavitalea sp. G-6-1-2]NML22624.1 outer membrane beta-barrel protein [Pseudoflavitalea sp. G-6-1-2]